MARVRAAAGADDQAAYVSAYDALLHGPGEDGVRRWVRAAAAYLHADWRRSLPDGDELGVRKRGVALLREVWFVPDEEEGDSA